MQHLDRMNQMLRVAFRASIAASYRVLARSTLACILLALFLLAPALPAQAQTSDWRERRTDYFSILYIEGSEADVETYVGFVDALYDEITALFNHRTPAPITLRLYPTLERYYEVNPLARGLTGVVAHADFRRRELAVILEQTLRQTDVEVQNNIRHELTHLIASELSNNRLNVGFQEGIAQYMEKPAPELERKIQTLQLMLDRDVLLPWSALDSRDEIYGNPDIGYPQTLSVVAFLIERYSFPRFREFLGITASTSGYRSALERAFGASPSELERAWRAWLPGYVAGGYRVTAFSSVDLGYIEAMIRSGRYVDAQAELELARRWIETTGQLDKLAEIEQLAQRARFGQAAERLAQDARTALADGDYVLGADLTARAQMAYRELNDTRQDDVLAAYAAQAERGMRAAQILREAQVLAEGFRYPLARSTADQAAREYLALGDRARAEQALDIRGQIDQRQLLAGGVLMAIGFFGIAISLVRRVTAREVEVW